MIKTIHVSVSEQCRKALEEYKEKTGIPMSQALTVAFMEKQELVK